jgi:putative transposase
VNAVAARAALDELAETGGHPLRGDHPALGERLDELIPFLDYDVEIRTVICSTNAIESLNARYRRAIKARGHFPTELAALKCLFLVTRSLDPTGVGRTRWAMRWKPALNAFAITFSDRFPSTET